MIDTLLHYFSLGGYYIMTPIFLFSVLSVAIILEKAITLRASVVINPQLVAKVKRSLASGNIDDAAKFCAEHNTPMTRIILAGLESGGEQARNRILDAGKLEALRLERYLTTLGTIANISPLFGLLGTVSGMIKVFFTIQQQGLGHSQAMAGGISEALMTTAFGLIVAIPALAAHNYFEAKAQNLVTHMEKHASDIAGML
ncbi:MotA/TolQ/ExbB proton channel family protein [Desulfurispirillum indicum]|uniref:MotA/TolQ/ExbB proton channel n=1 Tax=Desulfurispirillum indicum (strain ATCC BAA-1389 / DSM 22839 / S5) TaxID=653733 RepID=E6W7A0_DESIS|nr:MotA/TolQ/ExbB proton channel family protein [Desulfurispirillum indicum]ADU66267.1 MotA/TolQ/ExbB proton channel [Desulfurispirillum indicum S5]UCZ55598.1 MotA/TolQ/ExbB proton channel family protein [Desulfurispirillum indicum]